MGSDDSNTGGAEPMGSGGMSQDMQAAGAGGEPMMSEPEVVEPVIAEPPRINNGTAGFATRYWDCCKPHCGWQGNVNFGEPISSCGQQDQSLGDNFDAENACFGGGNAHMCHSWSPWAVSETLSYGFVAIQNGDICGRCYQLQFDGHSHNSNDDEGSQSLVSKTMIVQAINTGGVEGNQFDILVPGGGVGDFDACSNQWGTSNLGERYGGFFLACQKENNFEYGPSRDCARRWCSDAFENTGLDELADGCNWFVDWFGLADNPSFIYQEVDCPAGIVDISGMQR